MRDMYKELEAFLFGEKPRGELRAAPKPSWEWFPDWDWDMPRWALKEPAKAVTCQTLVRKPGAGRTGFSPAAFAACGKTR